MLRIKPGVKLHDLSPQILFALIVAEGTYAKLGVDCVVTSCNDSGPSHRTHSLHAVGHACDLRVHNLDMQSDELEDFALDILEALGGPVGQFDVVLEGVGTPSAHIHIEYQPHSAAR
jgi:hypothetical protein